MNCGGLWNAEYMPQEGIPTGTLQAKKLGLEVLATSGFEPGPVRREPVSCSEPPCLQGSTCPLPDVTGGFRKSCPYCQRAGGGWEGGPGRQGPRPLSFINAPPLRPLLVEEKVLSSALVAALAETLVLAGVSLILRFLPPFEESRVTQFLEAQPSPGLRGALPAAAQTLLEKRRPRRRGQDFTAVGLPPATSPVLCPCTC